MHFFLQLKLGHISKLMRFVQKFGWKLGLILIALELELNHTILEGVLILKYIGDYKCQVECVFFLFFFIGSGEIEDLEKMLEVWGWFFKAKHFKLLPLSIERYPSFCVLPKERKTPNWESHLPTLTFVHKPYVISYWGLAISLWRKSPIVTKHISFKYNMITTKQSSSLSLVCDEKFLNGV